jgi:hypothetical protein
MILGGGGGRSQLFARLGHEHAEFVDVRLVVFQQLNPGLVGRLQILEHLGAVVTEATEVKRIAISKGFPDIKNPEAC